MQSRILVIEDDPLWQDAITTVLRGAGYSVDAVDTPSAVSARTACSYDMLIVDIRLPSHHEGLQFLEQMRRQEHSIGTCRDRKVKVIISSVLNHVAVSEWQRIQWDAFLVKPYDLRDLLAEVDSMLSSARSKRSVGHTQEEVGQMSSKEGTFQEYVTVRQARQALLDSIRRAFRDLPAFCDAMDEALQVIRTALSAEKVLVTGWDTFNERFEPFWASGITNDDTAPIPPRDGDLSRLVVDKSLSISLFSQSDLNQEFDSVARGSAVNAPIWVRRNVRENLQAVLSVLDIDGLYKEEDRLKDLVHEMANVLGQEIDRSLGFGLSRQKLETGQYSLAHLLCRGTKWCAVLFADLRGSTPAIEVLGLRSGRATDEAGQPLRLPEPAQLVNDFCERMAQKVCIHGRIEKFIGDAVTGIFGDLFEEIDNRKTVLRAICSATLMYDAFQEMLAEWNDPQDGWLPKFRRRFNEDIDLRLGIGINYGPAVFDFYGSADYKQYMAIGDTANTAQRLEEQANKPDESGKYYEPILISQTMLERIDPSMLDAERYVLGVRGKAWPILAYGLKGFDRGECKKLVQCEDCPGKQWRRKKTHNRDPFKPR